MNDDYKYVLKWKIHDTLSTLGSSEDTFTWFYVYDLKEIHHYDNHNRFWIDKRQQKNRISHYVKQLYDSLNDDYECALKWKIHDTLSTLGSSEDTFTWFYVYDLKEIHHYDNHNRFWIDKRQQKNRISHYVKQLYDSLNDDYECALKWKIHDTLSTLGSSEDTFTWFYVYDLKEIHHYDNHNRFWIDKRQQKNRISHYVKQLYDSLNNDYECALKWKIHDTLSRLGSSEDTFTWFYVYDLKEIHHYDNHNRFWIDKRQQKNRISHYVKQLYDSLNVEYQEFYSGIRKSLGS